MKKDISFSFKGYVFRPIEDDEINEFCRLRHRVFCEELKWVPVSDNGLERDRYDDGNSVYLGVFSHFGGLIGGVRLVLPSGKGFMLQYEFRDFLDSDIYPNHEDSLEITRLAIDKRFRYPNGSHIALGLYKLIYRWSRQNNKRNIWYFVAQQKFIKGLKKLNFFLEVIGPGKKDSKDVLSLPVIVDSKRTKRLLLKKNIILYIWLCWL